MSKIFDLIRDLEKHTDTDIITHVEKFFPDFKEHYMLNKWMGMSFDPAQTKLTNLILNRYATALYRHPNLLIALAYAAVLPRVKEYRWPKVNKGLSVPPTISQCISEYTGESTEIARDLIELTTLDDLVGMAEDLGWEKVRIKKIHAEYEQFNL